MKFWVVVPVQIAATVPPLSQVKESVRANVAIVPSGL